ncbi:MAG: hypothetical protein M1840_000693 [Geoglossum simile]|nr:MAG: hypothetical protein M1840_000693 [Geoglossum simile]
MAPIPYATTIMLDPLVLNHKKDEELLLVYCRFLSLASFTQEEVLKLHVHHDRRYDLNLRQTHLKDVLDCNGLDLGVSDPGSIGLSLHVPRLNHSCVPNAEGYYDKKSGCVTIRALTDIRTHEEITISYIYHLLPRAQRQELLSKWRFVCQCSACDVRHLNSVVHEKRRGSLSSLQPDLLQYVDGSAPLTPATLRSRLTLELAAKKV